MERLLEALARDLEERGRTNLDECFVDGSFSPAKKGVTELGKPSGARASRSWRLRTALVFLPQYAHEELHRMRRNAASN